MPGVEELKEHVAKAVPPDASVTPAGQDPERPGGTVTDRPTVPEKLNRLATLTLVVPDEREGNEIADGLAEIMKSATLTVTVV